MILGVIAFFASVCVGGVYYVAEKNFEHWNTDTTLSLTSESAKTIKFIFDQGESIVRTVSILPLLKSVENLNKTSEAAIYRLLSEHNINNIFSSFYVMDVVGNTIISTDRSFLGHNFSYRNYFKQAISGMSNVDVAMGTVSGQMGYYFASPITNKEGKYIGVLIGKMLVEKVNDALFSSAIATNNIIMITDNNGVILGSNDSDRLLKSVGAMSAQQSEFEMRTRFPGYRLKELPYQVLMRAISEYSYPKNYKYWSKDAKNDLLFSVTKIGDLPFYMIVEIPIVSPHIARSEVTLQLAGIVIFSASAAGLVIGIILKKMYSDD